MTVVNFEGTVDRDFCIVGRANLKMLHSKSKMQFVKQERNTQKAIAHCAATINAKNANFHKQIFQAQIPQLQLYQIRKFLVR